jgi:hypothetical protein
VATRVAHGGRPAEFVHASEAKLAKTLSAKQKRLRGMSRLGKKSIATTTELLWPSMALSSMMIKLG